MGCWSETCAVTKYPVIYQQPVLMIVGKEYDGRLSAWWHNTDFHRRIQSVHYGTYNDYGWIKEVHHDDYCRKYADDRPDLRSIFIHKNVMDEILVLFPPEHPQDAKTWYDIYGEECPDHLDHLLSLAKFATDCRLDLNGGLIYKGCQHEPDYYTQLIEMMKKQPTKKTNEQ